MMQQKISEFYNKKRVLVTGHTGFKGSWLSMWLSMLGADVYGMSDAVRSEPANFNVSKLDDKIINYWVDINNFEDTEKVIEDVQPDIIFHLAAQAIVKEAYHDPVNTWNTNVIGTVNIIQASIKKLRKCKIVCITSDKCYENQKWPWGYRESDILGGADPYSASKAAAELVISSFYRSYLTDVTNIKICSVRAGNVIGGGDWSKDRIIPDAMLSAHSGKLLELRNPSATRPWQHVLEPLSGYILLAYKLHYEPDLSGQSFNFGPKPDENYSVVDVVNECKKIWDKVAWVDKSDQYAGPNEAALLKLSCEKASAQLHWEPTLSFYEAIAFTVEWYRAYYEVGLLDMRDYSEKQIKDYVLAARKRNKKWMNLY